MLTAAHIQNAFRYLGYSAEQLSFTAEDIECVKMALILYQEPARVNSEASELEIARIMYELASLSRPIRDRLFRRFIKRMRVFETRTPEVVYFEGVETEHNSLQLFASRRNIVSRYQNYLGILNAQLADCDVSFIVPSTNTIRCSDYGIDWLATEAYGPEGSKRYFPCTVADIFQTNGITKKVLVQLQSGGVCTFGGLHAVFRYESVEQLIPDWRERVFPQLDIKTARINPNEFQQALSDVQCVKDLVDFLGYSGISPRSIQLRVNDHWGIIGRLLEISGLDIFEIRQVRYWLDLIAKLNADGQPLLDDIPKEKFLGLIDEFRKGGNLDFGSFEFLRAIVLRRKFESWRLDAKFSEISKKVERLYAMIEVLNMVFSEHRLSFRLDPTLFPSELDSGFSGVADILCDDGCVAPEVASFSNNMSKFRHLGVYLSSSAIGVMRISNVANRLRAASKSTSTVSAADVVSKARSLIREREVYFVGHETSFRMLYPGRTHDRRYVDMLSNMWKKLSR